MTAIRFVLPLALVTLLPLACRDSTSPGNGGLVVVFSTSGIDPDEDGYLLTVDDGPLKLVQPNSEVRIGNLEPGEHVLRIQGQLPSCTIEGENPRTVVIRPDTPTTATFTVRCAARFGFIKVGAPTSGSDKDGDGYVVLVDNEPLRPLGASGTVSFGPLLPGEHSVALGGLAFNCTVADGTTRTVSLTAGDAAEVTFVVTCAALSSIRVTTVTTGVDPDPDNYIVVAANTMETRNRGVATNGSVKIDSLAPGAFQLSLAFVASNCDVADNPRVVTVTPGTELAVRFEIACITARRLVYTADVGTGASATGEIYVAKSNNTEVVRLTFNTFLDNFPTWSPDGARIAFSSIRSDNTDVYAMNADGSNVVRLTTSDSADSDPSWSPDGTRIAFVSRRDGDAEIYVMNADGTNPVRLTTSLGADVEPAWSPDGGRIAFRSARDLNNEIYVMSATGTNVTRLTRNIADDRQPAWSPNGARLAFARTQNGIANIVIATADGSAETRLVSPVNETEPSWSADGKIAYTSDYTDYADNSTVAIMAMRPDGTGRSLVVSWPTYSPAWRP